MVIYCICPDSATAVELTQRMRSNGYTRIRALRGGLDAWQRRGFPVEPIAPADDMTTGKRAPLPLHAARGAITLRGFAPRSNPGT
jgi:3-mercaptopyruvate sulfurtransferase SseA